MEIAGKLTIKDWAELEKKLIIDNDENWGLAFHFFEERIRTRYLNPINAILEMDLKTGEGFAVVNLQCSLIETIESFINGIKYEHPNFILPNGDIFKEGSNGIFISFFNNREPFKSKEINGMDFYRYVRCGLLHETQTKNGWKISANETNTSIKGKTINRNLFQKDIETLMENYKNAITKGEDLDGIKVSKLRENFKVKFKNICLKS